jgi:hypothetical protein
VGDFDQLNSNIFRAGIAVSFRLPFRLVDGAGIFDGGDDGINEAGSRSEVLVIYLPSSVNLRSFDKSDRPNV